MKSLKYTWLLCLAFLSAGFISCNDDDEYFDDKYQDCLLYTSDAADEL